MSDFEDSISTFKTPNRRHTTIITMGRRGRQNQGRPACLVCKKPGHETSNCRLLQAVNQNQKQQQNGNKQQQPKAKKSCNHCGKAGHIQAECFVLNPSLKNKPKGQQQQQGGGKQKCTFCNKNGHTADECFKAHPELRGQGGKNKQQQQQQQETRCTYCLMPNHNIDGCYLLHPELTNPFLQPQQQQQPQWAQPAGKGKDGSINNKTPPPARLTQRIRQAEAAGLELTPQEIRHHPKVRRVQGWSAARQTYLTLPLYAAAVARPVWHSENPFAQPTYQVAYEAYDASGDAVMCTCGCPEGFECKLQQWARKAVEKDKIWFSDRAEEGFGMIMRDGWVDPADIGIIY